VEVSFVGGGNRDTWRKPPTCRKSLTNLYRVHFLNWILFSSFVENNIQLKTWSFEGGNVVNGISYAHARPVWLRIQYWIQCSETPSRIQKIKPIFWLMPIFRLLSTSKFQILIDITIDDLLARPNHWFTCPTQTIEQPLMLNTACTGV
jgi:hypothetical protein